MPKSILVVDDNFDDLELMKSILEMDCFEVSVATNSSDAFELLKEKHFDLILAEIKMAGLSGYDLIRLFKEKTSRNIPVIFVSVVPKKEVDMHCSDGFVQKPFTEKTLLAEIERVFGNIDLLAEFAEESKTAKKNKK